MLYNFSCGAPARVASDAQARYSIINAYSALRVPPRLESRATSMSYAAKGKATKSERLWLEELP